MTSTFSRNKKTSHSDCLYTSVEGLHQTNVAGTRGRPSRISIERFQSALKAVEDKFEGHSVDTRSHTSPLGVNTPSPGPINPLSPFSVIVTGSVNAGDTLSSSETDGDNSVPKKRARKKPVNPVSSTPSPRRVLRQRPAPAPPALATQSFWPIPRPLPSTTTSASLHADLRPIKQVQLGMYLIDTWYRAPFPEEYSQIQVLYLCEFCLKYMKSEFVWKRHKENCGMKHPPGNEIYRDGALSIFEVDGRKNKIYCQNLCLLAKLFLDHKTLFYDVEPFLFYILTETDHQGCHFVAYFSKEKKSKLGHNLSCIMTLPSHQRKGYGQFLIDFSYLLSKNEHKVGSPEKPLSDLGLLSYDKYWSQTLQEYLFAHQEFAKTTIEEISQHTKITLDDIVTTLEKHGMLKKNTDGQFELLLTNDMPFSKSLRAKQDLLTWVPY